MYLPRGKPLQKEAETYTGIGLPNPNLFFWIQWDIYDPRTSFTNYQQKPEWFVLASRLLLTPQCQQSSDKNLTDVVFVFVRLINLPIVSLKLKPRVAVFVDIQMLKSIFSGWGHTTVCHLVMLIDWQVVRTGGRFVQGLLFLVGMSWTSIWSRVKVCNCIHVT